MNYDDTLWGTFKAFLTKACFTVGLCTVAYWSLAKVHHEMSPEPAKAVVSGEQTARTDRVVSPTQAVDAAPEEPVAVRGHSMNKIVPSGDSAPSDAQPAAKDTVASQSPPPADTPSPTPSGGLAQGQEANPIPENNYAQQLYPPGYGFPAPIGDAAATDGRKPDSKTGSAGDLNVGNPYNQPMGQLITSHGGSTVSGYTGVVSVNSAPTAGTSNLNSQDYKWVTTMQYRASVPNQQIPNLTARKQDNTLNSNYTVFSNRWSLTEGIKPEASFAIGSSDSAIPISVEATFTLLSQGVEYPVKINAKPTSINAKSDVRTSNQVQIPVRIYTFHFADQVVQSSNNSEPLHNVAVTLVLETDQTPPLLLDGSLTFNRSQVKTDNTAWNPAATPSTDWVYVDQMPFSMKLEKAP